MPTIPIDEHSRPVAIKPFNMLTESSTSRLNLSLRFFNYWEWLCYFDVVMCIYDIWTNGLIKFLPRNKLIKFERQIGRSISKWYTLLYTFKKRCRFCWYVGLTTVGICWFAHARMIKLMQFYLDYIMFKAFSHITISNTNVDIIQHIK